MKRREKANVRSRQHQSGLFLNTSGHHAAPRRPLTPATRSPALCARLTLTMPVHEKRFGVRRKKSILMGSMLEAIELSKAYGGNVALNALDLHIHQGEIFCLLGANGAGKTTTINLFLNFIPPSSGTAKINGLNVVEHPLETKRYLAYIPEQVMLYRNLTGIENLEYFTSLSGARYSRAQLLDFLAQAGLPAEAAEKRVSAYSKGMRQKVGIAIAIAKEAKALLLDEPTSGLDPKAANEFSELLKKMRDSGAAILVATHDLFRAKESGTRVGIMKHGRMVATLRTEEIGHAELEQIYLEHMHD
jgi:ABC-2 type transport system ATP-binding protein